MERHKFKERALKNEVSVAALMESDEDLVKMRQNFSLEFNDMFKVAFNLYVDGNWPQAKIEFEKVVTVRKLKGGDFPS
jgi:hypothetical protein